MRVGCAAVPFDSRAGVRRQLAEPGAFLQLSPSPAEAEPSGGAGGAGRRAARAGQAASRLAGDTGRTTGGPPANGGLCLAPGWEPDRGWIHPTSP